MKELFNFRDIGKKIKKIAKWSCWVEIVLLWIASPILLLVLLADGYMLEAFWVFVFGILGAFAIWVGYWLLYAFGDLVDNITYLRKQICPNVVEEDEEETQVNGTESEMTDVKADKKFICPNCGVDVFYGETECKSCGQKYDWNKL